MASSVARFGAPIVATDRFQSGSTTSLAHLFPHDAATGGERTGQGRLQRVGVDVTEVPGQVVGPGCELDPPGVEQVGRPSPFGGDEAEPWSTEEEPGLGPLCVQSS